MEVAVLSGRQLDYWVAKAERLDVKFGTGRGLDEDVLYARIDGGHARYAPSSNWRQAGPIMERERIQVTYLYELADAHGFYLGDEWEAVKTASGRFATARGGSYLEAAMRCYVASAFGREVPDESEDAAVKNDMMEPR